MTIRITIRGVTMAEMIPESVPSGRPRGERRVFDILQYLPDDYIVYHEPFIAQRYPDFVVICPDLGLMVIEVKGWTANNIERADSNRVVLSFGGAPEAHEHPLIQAKNYKYRLMNTFKDDPAIGPIRHSEGRYQGGFIFPFGHIAVLSSITSEQLQARGLTTVFPPSLVVTKDILDSWEQIKGEGLREKLKRFFEPFWEFPRLNEKQINLLRAVIHPEIIVRRVEHREGPPSEVSRRVEHQGSPSSEVVLHVLDKRQEVLARKIGGGHRVLNGVAGSGKTVLLIHRAKWLSSEDANRRILVLCYNKCLAAYLKDALQGCQNVRATTFHQWGMGFGVRFSFKADSFGQKVFEKTLSMAEQDKYDAIFIDEAQDFHPIWLKSAVAALKDSEEGDLIVVADGNQGLYRPADFRWIDVGIKARGRVIPLYRNYRNTEQIMHVAKQFAEGQQDTGEQIVPLMPQNSIRNGPAPLAIKAANRPDEVEKIVGVVKDLLSGNWNSSRFEAPLLPSEIAILYSHLSRRKKVPESIELLRAKLKTQNILAVWLQDPADDKAWMKINDPGVKIQTIHSAKGLQYRAVIMMRADILPIPGNTQDEAQDERLMYVGLTRAEDYLAITFPGHSSFTQRVQTACQEAGLYITFHCEHCDYCGKTTRSKFPADKKRFRVKCPKCNERTPLSLQW